MPRIAQTITPILFLAFLAGCSCASDPPTASDPAGKSTTTLGPSENPAATATTTPDQQAAANQLADQLDTITITDPLATHCVTARASFEEDLARQLTDDAYVSELVETCEAHATISRALATSIGAEQALNQQQLDCLTSAYAALKPEVIDIILSSGTTPGLVSDEQAQVAEEAIGTIKQNCVG